MTVTHIVNKFISDLKDWPRDFQKPVQRAQKRESDNPLSSLITLWNDFLYQMEDSGIYGASIAILSVIVNLELKKRAAQSKSQKNAIRVCITGAEMINHMLQKEMSDIQSHVERALVYGSTKLKMLIQYLTDYMQHNDPDKMKCLVFVQRRYTAKCIFHIIRLFSENNPLFPVKPDFIVGVNNRIPISIENILETKWQRRVLEMFKKNETNLIVASSVLEEGVDLQMCNVVISYDNPTSFRSYAQSKGRARMATSKYVMMVPSVDYQKFCFKVQEFRQIAEILNKVC